MKKVWLWCGGERKKRKCREKLEDLSVKEGMRVEKMKMSVDVCKCEAVGIMQRPPWYRPMLKS